MKYDTTRAIFSKQNEMLCNTILCDLDTWLSSKFIDSNTNVAFHKSAAIRVCTYTIDQRKNQNQVKYNDYASRLTHHQTLLLRESQRNH
jgi:hypothetical protein